MAFLSIGLFSIDTIVGIRLRSRFVLFDYFLAFLDVVFLLLEGLGGPPDFFFDMAAAYGSAEGVVVDK